MQKNYSSTLNLQNYPSRSHHQTEEQVDKPVSEDQSRMRHPRTNLQENVSYRGRFHKIPWAAKDSQDRGLSETHNLWQRDCNL